MEERYVLAEGRGWLSIREENGRAICRVELTDDRRGLYKVWLLRGSGELLLGALTPEQGVLCLRRTLSVEDLTRRQFWPPTGGTAELAYAAPRGDKRQTLPAGWTWERTPGRLLGERMLARAAESLPGALVQRTREGFRLAVPYAVEKPFALTPLFCFAQPAALEERDYMIFSFDGRGRPIFPHKDAMAGETNHIP